MTLLCRIINYTFLALFICVFFDWFDATLNAHAISLLLLFCLFTASCAAVTIAVIEGGLSPSEKHSQHYSEPEN